MKSLSPYSLAHELPKNDERISVFKQQFKERGFDDTELWNLFHTIASFILPRLQAFKESSGGYPGNLTHEKWIKILTKMIKAFELIIRDDVVYNDSDSKAIDVGLDLFRDYFLSLWD